MSNPRRYPFVAADSALGEASLRPYLPLTLTYQGQIAATAGLLDTGQPLMSCLFALALNWVQFGNNKQRHSNLLVI